jgi:hypothetical protein
VLRQELLVTLLGQLAVLGELLVEGLELGLGRLGFLLTLFRLLALLGLLALFRGLGRADFLQLGVGLQEPLGVNLTVLPELLRHTLRALRSLVGLLLLRALRLLFDGLAGFS